VFEGKGRDSIIRYYILAIGILALDYGILYILTALGVPELLGKIIAGAVCYPVSFYFQRRFVFVLWKPNSMQPYALL